MKNIYKAALLSSFLLFATFSQAQTPERSNNSKNKTQQTQTEYQTETYKYTKSKKSEPELKKQILALTGVHDVQINSANSTIIVKFDTKKNTKTKLTKSFKTIGLSGKFTDTSKSNNVNENSKQNPKDKTSDKSEPVNNKNNPVNNSNSKK